MKEAEQSLLIPINGTKTDTTNRAISASPYYPTMLRRLKSGNENFLDLGCCFGQELRKVAADGAPSARLYACDLRPEFFELGYKLFRDRGSLASTFIAADIFNPPAALTSLYGSFDVIYAGSFLHLFGYAEQVKVCMQIVKLLRDRPDSALLGRQVGNVEAGEQVHRTNKNQTMFRHNGESFKRMWDEVGELTGTKWNVETEMLDPEEGYMSERAEAYGPNVRRLRFSVFRV